MARETKLYKGKKTATAVIFKQDIQKIIEQMTDDTCAVFEFRIIQFRKKYVQFDFSSIKKNTLYTTREERE